MSLPKLRDIGSVGVIADLDPFNIPPNGFTFAKNVRFRNGRVTSAPVFKSVTALGTLNPRFTTSFTPTQGLDFAFIGYENGRVFRYASGSETDYSISGYAPSVAEAVWTSCYLADTIYINRSDRAPWSLGLADARFLPLANMDSAWTAALLKVCGGALVALNVTKSGVQFQTMVKTSSFALAGAVPASWDFTLPNTNATENILAEMQGPIVDACNLGRDLCIYGQNEGWRMTPTGAFDLFQTTKLPFSKGAINANCSIEINSQNFVFGVDDLWVHDGVSEKSICDQRVRDFIFGSLDLTKANRCFIAHNRQLHELHFCYVSGDEFVAFSSADGPDGCNRSAVYDYIANTWTFDDRPFVYHGALMNLDTTQTWTTTPFDWDTVNGTWASQDDTAKRVLCYLGDVDSFYGLTENLYAFDPYATSMRGMPVSLVSFPVALAANGFPYLERSAVDMSLLGADLRDYVQISTVIPLARIDNATSKTLDFSIGSSDTFDQDPIYSDYQGYDGQAFYKIDVNVAGRYLAFRVKLDDVVPFSWSGFDFDAQVLGSR